MDQPSQPDNSLSTIDDDDEQRRAASVMVATIAAAAGELANAYFGFIRAVVHRNDKKCLTDGRSSARSRQKKENRTTIDNEKYKNNLNPNEDQNTSLERLVWSPINNALIWSENFQPVSHAGMDRVDKVHRYKLTVIKLFPHHDPSARSERMKEQAHSFGNRVDS